MLKKFFQKNISTFLFSVFYFFSFFLSKTSANVGVDNINTGIENIGSIVITANKTIAGPVILFLSGICAVVFLYFLITFLIHRNKGDDTQLGKDKKNLLWSMVALFILVTIWGIIQIAQGLIGITDKDRDIRLPKICINDACDTSSFVKKSSSNNNSNNNGGNNSKNNNTDKLVIFKDDGADDKKEVRILSDKIKDVDKDVSKLQEFLFEEGCYESNDKKNEIDGRFATETKKALIKWQKINVLEQDGEFGPESQAKKDDPKHKPCKEKKTTAQNKPTNGSNPTSGGTKPEYFDVTFDCGSLTPCPKKQSVLKGETAVEPIEKPNGRDWVDPLFGINIKYFKITGNTKFVAKYKTPDTNLTPKFNLNPTTDLNCKTYSQLDTKKCTTCNIGYSLNATFNTCVKSSININGQDKPLNIEKTQENLEDTLKKIKGKTFNLNDDNQDVEILNRILNRIGCNNTSGSVYNKYTQRGVAYLQERYKISDPDGEKFDKNTYSALEKAIKVGSNCGSYNLKDKQNKNLNKLAEYLVSYRCIWDENVCPSSSLVKVGASTTLPARLKNNNVFLEGWGLEKNSKDYLPGETISDLSGDLLLFAVIKTCPQGANGIYPNCTCDSKKYDPYNKTDNSCPSKKEEAKSFSVYFDCGDGAEENDCPNDIQVREGEIANSPEIKILKTNYIFDAWIIDLGNYGRKLIKDFPIKGNITFKASYKKIEQEVLSEKIENPKLGEKNKAEEYFFVYFYCDGGEGEICDKERKIKKGDKIGKIEDPRKEGHKFKGWKKDFYSTSNNDITEFIVDDEVLFTAKDNEVLFTAQWEIEKPK